jgi:hypothetical protein
MIRYRAVLDNKRFCPKEKVSQGKTNCWECEYFSNWTGDPHRQPLCWFEWESEEELRAIDEKFGG